MADLLLDSRAGMLRGGKSGAPAVVPGKPEDSLLIAAVRGANKVLRMPPDKPLEGNEIDNLIEWVKAGAPDPRNELNPQAGLRSAYDWDKARRHWAFGPIQDPRPPRVASAEWSKSPIDQFIKAKLDEKALIPLPGASKLALIRRATYDLSGLPPTRKEVDAFIKDTSAEAFEKVVDRLLGSEQYGERWGRHWLDVVRYADTSGDSSDFPVPEMYRYRNWVIAAFNRDKPYNQFLREQLAGDILAANDKEGSEDWRRKVIAKGYLANSRRFGSLLSEFHLTIDDTIDNLGKGILGLSVSCARCHDHKFDPIPTTDYYALYGIFRSSNYPHPGTEIFPHPYGFVALEGPEQASKLKSFEAELSELDRYLHDVKLGNIKFPDKEHQKNAQTETEDKIRRLTSQYPYFRKAYAVMEGTPGNAPVLIKGDPAMLGPVVPRGFLTLLGGQKVSSEEKGSGRLELADWITDPKNPLTARVIVNRIWTWHFGQGIVATPDDFGTRGARPTHPELLDYLATRFIESGWSIKRMHKLIMLSRTYQMASGNDERNAAKDPENTYLWKFKRRRMDAEEIRDSLLAVSGKLDPAIVARIPFLRRWGGSLHNTGHLSRYIRITSEVSI